MSADELGALPMPVPVGPEPLSVCSLCAVVKPDGAAMRDHVRNVHPDEFCGLYHEQPCRHGAAGPEPLSAERLAGIAARAEAATAGPWWTDTLAEHDGSESVGIDAEGDIWIIPCQDIDQADAEFMAHARVDVPALVAEVHRQAAEVASLDEALTAAAERMRADAARIAELEALTPARVQTCRVCGAGYTYGEPCSSCLFKARMAAELQARGLDGEHFEAVHHSYRLGHDLPETGGPQ